MSFSVGSILNSYGPGANSTPTTANETTPVSFADSLDEANLASGKGTSAVDKFMAYQKMSPGEKIRASFLAAHGLTEDDLKGMSPEERQKIEDEIKEEIRKKLAEKTGDTSGAPAIAS